jgi:tetratricopeptide (TPR) repeat protein
MSLPELQEPLALLEQKDFGTAVDVLERKVTVLPAHLGAHVLLAYAYEAQQRWDQALEAWKNAHFLMPNSPIAEEGKRRVLRRMDGIEGDGDPSPLVDFPEFDPSPPGPTETTSESEPDEEEPADAESSSANEEEPTDDDFGLAELRRQAEREARQGGARPGLSDPPPSADQPASPEKETPPTPEEQVEQLDEGDETDDLDRLIDDLKSARIDPDPDAEAGAPPPDPHDVDEDDHTEKVVSETLARIHEGQNDFQRAAQIYAQLAEQEPDRTDEFREKATEMREKADGTGEDS